MSQSDLELLARIHAGDKTACAQCMEEHAPAVYRLALRLMHNEAEAQEVAQETFLNAFKGIDEFDARSELTTWLYRIAYNTALMRLRRPKPEFDSVEELSEPQDGSAVPPVLFDWCCLPEPELDNSEAKAELGRAIQDLPEKLRIVFVMRELEDISTAAVAEALQVSPEVVKTRLHRARLQLRETLADYFGGTKPSEQ
jgi:RNA polymerase sigma-70 factor (ECF subfamily)